MVRDKGKKAIADKVQEIVKSYDSDPSAVIAILQDVQAEFNYLPREALVAVSEAMNIPLSRVYEISTFYNAFSLKPRGRHVIEICAGTACHVQGGDKIMDRFERELGISRGETTSDGMFTLEEVRCLGCCSLAAVARIDGNIHPFMKQDDIPRILKKYRKHEVK
ncbi:MAG: NADH-quinone oxidoreductase subunit NuoE [Syntrophales bacterium]|nr:NADH-quinone oxidoreductase subunit NuoE [Syntrophales bacterium]